MFTSALKNLALLLILFVLVLHPASAFEQAVNISPAVELYSPGQKAIIKALPSMVKQINLDPWASYQKIQTLSAVYNHFSVENKLWFLLRKAQTEMLLYFFDDFKKTVAQAQVLLKESHPAEIVSGINFFTGMVAQRNNNYKLALDYFKKGMKIARASNLSILYVQGKLELAYTRSLIEAFETSLIDLQEAYVEAFTMQDDFLLALINESYGAIYGYMGEYEKSINYYEKALTSYQKFGYPAHVSEATFGMATTYRYWGKYDVAIEYYSRYQKALSYSPNQDILFFAYYGLGMTLSKKGDCNKALTVIEQGLKLNGFIDYKAELYKQKALCFIALKQIDAAKVALKKAEDIFANLPELMGTSWQLEVIKIASDIEFLQGNMAQAYQLLKTYYKQNTDLLIENSSARLSKVRSSLELEQKNVEIALLSQQSKVHQLQVEKERQLNEQQKYLIVITLVMIVLAILFIVYQRQTNKKVLALSIIDPLSDLYNRRYTFEFLEKLLSVDNSDKGQLSVILIDIDNFKEINDLYGHPFGDEVIQRVAEIGKITLRAEDVMGRIGGEEFLCILPRLDVNQGVAIAERLRENISLQSFDVSVQITVSIGVASLSDTSYDTSTLYLHADTALYQAKAQGKNTVVAYQAPNENTSQADINKNISSAT